MANLPVPGAPGFPDVYQLELTDRVKGGAGGTANLQALQLLERTAYLKNLADSLNAGKQPLDPTLTALAAIATSADKLIYATGPDAFAVTPLSAFIRTLLDDADATAALATLGAASTAYVQNAIAALVNSSPAALDTLNELAAALGNDANFATTINNALALKAPLNSPAMTGAPTTPTPPQFDATNKVATMAAIQRALGSISGVTAFNATAALTAAHAGQLISLYGTGGFVVTLPSGATLATGTAIQFFGALTSGNVAVVRAGTDTISVASNSVTGLTLYPGSSLTLVWNGLVWTAWGETQLPYSPLFAANLAGGGPFFQKLPGGFVMIFGSGVVNPSGDLIATFPFTLAGPPLSCFAMSGQNMDAVYGVYAKSATSATWPFYKTSTGAKSTGGFGAEYFVIGKLP